MSTPRIPLCTYPPQLQSTLERATRDFYRHTHTTVTEKPIPMRRRTVILTLEVETVLTLAELKKPRRIVFNHRNRGDAILYDDPAYEKEDMDSYGTIVQVQANAVKPAPVKAKAKPGRKRSSR